MTRLFSSICRFAIAPALAVSLCGLPALAQPLQEDTTPFLKRPSPASPETIKLTEQEGKAPSENIGTGPIYTPAPKNSAGEKDELHTIAFDFNQDIRPTLERYCFDCHDSDNVAAET